MGLRSITSLDEDLKFEREIAPNVRWVLMKVFDVRCFCPATKEQDLEHKIDLWVDDLPTMVRVRKPPVGWRDVTLRESELAYFTERPDIQRMMFTAWTTESPTTGKPYIYQAIFNPILPLSPLWEDAPWKQNYDDRHNRFKPVSAAALNLPILDCNPPPWENT